MDHNGEYTEHDWQLEEAPSKSRGDATDRIMLHRMKAVITGLSQLTFSTFPDQSLHERARDTIHLVAPHTQYHMG